ncbi:hypothetical protein FOZ63_010456 [Perkinsus olseni]|uniref:Mei2-like C-terminal RNA recognition motif domain-containing protein n=1 Tax=Perkinsus olseni TaxID=32597 RepID=A0A7J6RWE8_PEROL|nr:hypothetical protein FOZ63_010456 [Perkinsus olseni]
MASTPSSNSPMTMGRGLWSDILASVVRAMNTPPQVGEEITFVDSQGYQCTARIVRRVQPSEEPEVSSTFKIPAEAGEGNVSHELGSMKLSVRNSFLHISMSDTAYDQVGASGVDRSGKRRSKSADAPAEERAGSAVTPSTGREEWESHARQLTKSETPATGVSEVPTVNPSSSISQREPPSMASSAASSTAPCKPPSSLAGSEVRDNPNDPRTTLMIRNIPTKFTQSTLLEVINTHGFSCTYDFFYLPIDFR